MLNFGKKNCASRDNKIKYSNSCVVQKKISERNKNPYPTPLQVKWSVPYILKEMFIYSMTCPPFSLTEGGNRK